MSDAQQQPPAPLPTGAAETDEESAAKEEDACVAEPATAAAPPPRRPQRAASAAAAVPVTHSPAPLRATRRITHALTATALGERSVARKGPAPDGTELPRRASRDCHLTDWFSSALRSSLLHVM
jgi:hypothetical protein